MPCCNPFPGIKGTKHPLDVMSDAEVDSELVASGITADATFYRWLRKHSPMGFQSH